ncbi:hypothetical protein [Halomarina litorea]|uniref:hypothetical protein n=1 Tax=Halomarina litorea TaxID=2961595 RepID=UPI0020C33079|nr:hypothetical protein [Halomarina sp. BCD28]
MGTFGARAVLATPRRVVVAVGVAAWALGLVGTALWLALVTEGPFGALPAGTAFADEPTADWKVVGWPFYSAQFVDVRSVGLQSVTVTRSPVGLLVDRTERFPPVYLLPPVLLTVAGTVATASVSASDGRPLDPVAGAHVAFGYLPATLLVVAIDPFAAVVAGLVSPATFGFLGGVLATLPGRVRASHRR